MGVRQRHWKNVGKGGQVVFFTTTVLDFVPVFGRHGFAEEMVGIIKNLHRITGSRLHAYVVMPEHIHFISLLHPEVSAITFMKRLKSFSARELKPRLSPEAALLFDQQRGLNGRTFWQRSFRSVPVTQEWKFSAKIRYIHRNPVKRGLCRTPEEYPFSSARAFDKGLWRVDEGLPL